MHEPQILDTDSEESFDRITKAASKFFSCPICLVSLVDAERQWFKSCIGLGVNQTSRCPIAMRARKRGPVMDILASLHSHSRDGRCTAWTCSHLRESLPSRDLAFCAHAILPQKPTTLVVENALMDERFKHSPLVTGAPFIRSAHPNSS